MATSKIGPFQTYAAPGVYASTTTESPSAQQVGNARIPMFIGVGQEALTQNNIEIIRGSSSVVDTPIFGEDPSGRWVASGSNSNPTLGSQNGNLIKFRVRNFPIVDGDKKGNITFDASKVSVIVDGEVVVVSEVDGINGIVSLLIPPSSDSVVSVSYFFSRKDTQITDDVSSQVTKGAAVLVAPKFESYSISLNTSDSLSVVVDDTVSTSIKLTPGNSRSATDLANDVNSASVPGLTASVHTDSQGLNHLQLIALGNIRIGSGNANGALGFNSGDQTNRNSSFRVFQGPIVDGSDGGITSTDPSKLTVLVNGVQVIAKSVDGFGRLVSLPFAPRDGSVVTIRYYFNTFQDTFDSLPNSNIISMGSVGIAPGRRDYLNGPDFTVTNEGLQSKIQWGTSFQVLNGVRTGSLNFGPTQISGLLIDNKIYGQECPRFTDPVTSTVSKTKFILNLSPTTGNGRDTPLSSSLFNSITNGRIELPTNRPDLVTVYVGKNWRDAFARPSVKVLEVDSSTNTFVLQNDVPADYKAFATFYYNRISDDTYTLSVSAVGASGLGRYTITSGTKGPLLNTKFGTKSGLSQTIQWPSGVENVPDAFHSGDGTPVPETVTVTFNNSLGPATNASFSNSGQDPYDVYTNTRVFGGVAVDGNSPISVDLSTAFSAILLSQPVSAPLSFLSTDRLVLNIDGVNISPIDISAATTMAGVVTAINSVIDADAQVHSDGSGTFFSTAPNNLASSVTYGSKFILKIAGRNVPSSTNGLTSNVTVMSPTAAGQTDSSTKVGLSPNLVELGLYNSLNQPASMVGSKSGPFNVQTGLTDLFQVTVDGVDVSTILQSGSSVPSSSVVSSINLSYLPFASSTDSSAYLSSLIVLANELKTDYEAHRVSVVFHSSADSTNIVSSSNATDLATLIVLLNELKTDYNAHRTQSSVHQVNDSVNVVAASNATDLLSAGLLAIELKQKYGWHLSQSGVHGFSDTTNVTSSPNATDLSSSITLANELKTDYNAHRTQSGSHLSTDPTSVTATNASDLPTVLALANQLKTVLNTHIAGSWHTTPDTTNVISSPNATDQATANTLLNELKAKFNAHRTQSQGGVPVHSTSDTTNTVSSSPADLIARVGLGSQSGKIILTSRLNDETSGVAVRTTGTSNDMLGFAPGSSSSRKSPTASSVAAALNFNSGFNALAVAWKIQSPGLGNFLRLDSRTSGSTSTISFTNVANTVFVKDTGIGITPGTSGDAGENAQSGFSVTSSAGLSGSHGTGFTGQTYTDSTTGLRFTILPASAGDYSSNGSFTLPVSLNFPADASIPTYAIPGIELTVFNTVGMNVGTTGLVNTFSKTGNEPRIGDVYYVSYSYQKNDLRPVIFSDMRRVEANFGPASPENPVSLAASLAFLNGATMVGIKQVLRDPGSSQATVGSFISAIDEMKKPLRDNLKPDVIVPLSTDLNVMSYVSQHCISMSTPRNEGERTGIVGVANGTSPLGAQSIARGLSSELMIVVYPDSAVVAVPDSLGNFSDRLVDGSYVAAALAGSVCNPTLDVATPITRRKLLGFKSLGRILDPTDADRVATSGITVMEPSPTGSIRVRHGLTTNLSSVITRTPSVIWTIQFVQQTVRRVLDPYIGQKFTGTLLKSVESSMTGAFSTLIDNKIVTAVAGINVYVDDQDPTILRTEAVYSPVFPLEYIVAAMNVKIRI
jgi:hypothetical protein